MTITYCRNDPVSSRWTGLGRLLTEFEVDYNFYQHESRITTLEANYRVAVSIASISQPTSSTLLFTMSDSSTQGPFTLPVSTFQDRSTWQPSTPYLINDTFTANGSLYRVLVNHTSGATFSPTANDGAGHDYYSTMMSNPGNALPAGGATGQVMQKSTGADYSVTWGYKLPTGGTANQVLLKQSPTNQDAAWTTLGASMVSFNPSTVSGLISTNVASALEEIEVNLHSVAAAAKTTLHDLTDVNVTEGAGIDGYFLKYDNASGKWIAIAVAAPSFTIADNIQFVIDGGGAAIATGMKGYIEVPYNCTITGAMLFSDQTGSIAINIYKCTYAQFDAGSTHPVLADKITASTPPTLSTASKYTDTTLTGWTTSITAGDILAFNVDTAAIIQRVTISLTTTRTVT